VSRSFSQPPQLKYKLSHLCFKKKHGIWKTFKKTKKFSGREAMCICATQPIANTADKNHDIVSKTLSAKSEFCQWDLRSVLDFKTVLQPIADNVTQNCF